MHGMSVSVSSLASKFVSPCRCWRTKVGFRLWPRKARCDGLRWPRQGECQHECAATWQSRSGDRLMSKETGALAQIHRQIMWNRLIAVVEEQAQTMIRTAFSTTMREGDHYITNDPWLGTGHLHDLTVTTPAFHRGRIVGLFANTAHVIDIGGLGMGPEGRSVFEEGMYIPIVKCFDRGAPNETFFDFMRAGSRLPVELEGDIYSLCACNDAAAKRLAEMMDEFDMTSLDPLAEFIF